MNHPDDPEHARFAELNALAGVLPYHRRDELSSLLSDADVARRWRAFALRTLSWSRTCLRFPASGH